MAKLLRFDGRVALVTGAGGGLGRDYALMLASRGAKVVVNDLGGNMHGEGKSSGRPADEVVSMIKSRGGVAVPNYDSVEDGDSVVKTAIDNFGRLDILVNNAGILRDRSLLRMSDNDWDLVYKVHLKGAFKVTRAAFAYMKKQNYGRIVMTTSPSGLYGNFGQANYSAAKMGVVGLSNTVCKEGEKYNILCNTIAPQAWSRMTASLYPPMMEDLIKTEDVAPVVSFLCHENCPQSGAVFETAGGWISKVMVEGSEGVVLQKPFTVEDVEKVWSKVCDMSKSHRFTNGSEGMASDVMPRLVAAGKGVSGEEGVAEEKSDLGQTETATFDYTSRDVMLYALGIGCNLTQSDTSDLKYLYEGHPDFSVIPSFAVIVAQGLVMNGGVFRNGIPGIKSFNLAQALHGEQYVELLKPLPPSGTLTTEGKIVEVLDKKSGALIIVETITKNESGEVVAINQFTTFIIGCGGFGGKTKSHILKPIVPAPKRAPDASRQCKTLSSQAALYRLNGDYNPLHVDPDFAKLGGFQTPILHGLCSYGIATRHIVREYCGDDVTKVKAIKARFSKPVLPGNTIQTDMWKEGNRIHFICKVAETGKECLSGGYIDVTDTIAPAVAAKNDDQPDASLQSTAVFNQLKEHLSSNPDIVRKVKAVYQWNITKDGKTVAKWTADLKNGSGSIYPGEPKGEKPGCTITIADDDFMDLVTGKLDPQQAFFKGKMKLAGNIMLGQKLQALFPSNMAKL